MRLQPKSNLGARIAVILALALVASACEAFEPGGFLRPWYCDPTDTAINDGHAGGGGHMPHYTVEKGPLSADDCMGITVYLGEAEKYASQFPTAGSAEANGWHHLAPWIAGQGTHHLNIADDITSTFNPWRPNLLMYDSNADSGKLTGMVWAVRSGTMPPAGFPGDNDHWHFHEKLCYAAGPFIVGDNITDEECTARGGINEDTSDVWLLHVWLPTYEGWEATDIFNKSHPTV